jgi:hypothetical protein
MWLWTIAGVAAFGGIFYNVYRPGHDGYDIRGYMMGRDFLNIWMGSQLVHEGNLATLYFVPEYMARIRQDFTPNYYEHNFSYPPHILAFIVVFGLLPYFPALFLWTVGGIAALFAGLRAQAASWHVLMLSLFSPATVANVISGQNGFFVAACFLGGFYLSNTAPVMAGILFGILTIKPHLGILVPFALLFRRNWKCIGSAIATTLVLAGISVAIWGTGPWHDYVTLMLPYQKAGFLKSPKGFFMRMMPGFYSDARIVMNMSDTMAMILQFLAAFAAVLLVFPAVRRDGINPRTVAMLAIASLIVLPYDFNYDMVMVAGAMAVYLSSLNTMYARTHLIFGMLWALPLAVYALKSLPMVPFSSAILMLSLVLLRVQPRENAEAAALNTAA